MDNRLTRALATGAASVMLLGGFTLTTGSATAAPSHHPAAKAHKAAQPPRCHWRHGYWTRIWHPGWRDHNGHWHHGYWTRVWHRGFWVCPRR